MSGIFRRITSFLPEGSREFLGEMHGALRGAIYAGSSFYCPFCRGSFRKMIRWDPSDPEDDNMVCPRCQSQSRHRLLNSYLTNETNLFDKPARLLHFAPEPFFFKMFERAANIDYVPVDMMMPSASIHVDIRSLPFPDKAFDAIICNHVLEHVVDDTTAIKELSRVLRPNGWAVVLVPIDYQRSETFEDPSVTDPLERLRLFGQSDHVRIYGRDYVDRLRSGDWSISELNYAEGIEPELKDRFALMQSEYLYIARKPGCTS